MTTFAQLITRTQTRLSMVSGIGVQIYSEDAIAEMLQHKFDVLFEEAWWPQFLTWATWTLDGTLGVVTTDLTDLVKRPGDIRIIYPDASNTPITKLSASTINPFNFSGTTALQYQALGPGDANKTTRVFHIWPKTATGNIIVQYRTKPDNFVVTDTVDFDEQALVLGATFDYLEDDGTNANASQKFQNLFEARVLQLKNTFNDAPISLDPVGTRPEAFSFTSL